MKDAKGQKIKYIKFSDNRTMEEANDIYHARINDAKIIYDKFNNTFEYRPCPICGSKEYVNIDKFIDLYDIALCSYCNSEYVNPVPNSEALSFYYNNCENNILFEKLNKRRHKKSFINDGRINFLQEYIKNILHSKDNINILEVGCNNGTFLSTLKDYLVSENLYSKCNLYGIDLDANAINNSVDSDLDLRALAAEEVKSLETNFDLIINFELIEHLSCPRSFVKSLYLVMNDGAYLVLTTPNSLGLEIKAVGYNKTRLLAHSIFPPMHLNAFNTQNILLFANKNKLKLKFMDTPGKLDMDMISILPKELDDENLEQITQYPEEVKAYFQYLTAYLNGSTHMRIVLSK